MEAWYDRGRDRQRSDSVGLTHFANLVTRAHHATVLHHHERTAVRGKTDGTEYLGDQGAGCESINADGIADPGET